MTERINIVLSQVDRWDYSEFVSRCISQNIRTLCVGEWSQKVGMLTAAQTRYPEDAPWDAYMKLISNFEYGRPIEPIFDSTQPCGTCGGGTLL